MIRMKSTVAVVDPPTVETQAESVKTEHRSLRGRLSEFELLVREPGLKGRELVTNQLRSLTDWLRGHFDAEVRGHMFTSLPVEKPRFATRLERLAGEHTTLLDQAAELAEHLDQMSGHQLTEVTDRVLAFIEAVRSHEEAEEEILASAYDDLGDGD